jgi:hypothetical protein
VKPSDGATVTQALPAPNAIDVRQGPRPTGRFEATAIRRVGPLCDHWRYTLPVGQSSNQNDPKALAFSPQFGRQLHGLSKKPRNAGYTEAIDPSLVVYGTLTQSTP